MASKVFLAEINPDESFQSIQNKLFQLFDAADFSTVFQKDDLVAVKTHFGEDGNANYIKAPFLMPLIQKLKALGSKPFWTETNTLYTGRRSNAVEHMQLANEHGFSFEATGIPVIIGDGVTGREETIVEINGRHSKKAGISPAVAAADSLLVISHATGHLACGYGGAIKNLGMGLSSRKGKLYQHSVVKPRVKTARCKGDGICIKWCPVKAISMIRDRAVINDSKCIGCGECLAACRPGAIAFQWKIDSVLMQERMAEQALGVLKAKENKIGFVTFIMDVAKDCDCLPSKTDDILLKSLGVVASKDVVAIECATVTLIEKALGPLRDKAYDIDFTPQMKYAEELGMGSSAFELVKV